jgi:hypothetical protein
MKGGVINGNSLQGIVFNGQNYTFSDLQIIQNSWGTQTYPTNLGSYAGVTCGATCIKATFSNCQSGDIYGSGSVQKYGIELLAGARDVSWVGGSLRGNLQAAWDDSSNIGAQNFRISGAAGNWLDLVGNTATGTQSGFGARATCTVVGGVITAVAVTAGGTYYDLVPAVYAYDPAGTGVIHDTVFTATINSSGAVTGVTVTPGATPNSGYSSGALIYFVSQSTQVTTRPYYPTVSNVNYSCYAKGTTGVVRLGNDYGVSFVALTNANAVNYFTVAGNATGTGPSMYASGTDTNIDIQYIPKGTGISIFTNAIKASGKIFPGTDGAAAQTVCGLYAGTGAPNNSNGNNGDMYFDAANTGGKSVYQKRSGSWVGVV